MFRGAKDAFEITSFQETRDNKVPAVLVVSNSFFDTEQCGAASMWYVVKESARIRAIKRSRPVAITIEIDESMVPFR